MSKSSHGQNRSGYLSEDTIAAIAAPPGGAVCLVRVSGPASLSVLSKICGEPILAGLEPRKVIRSSLKDAQGALIDDALFTYFQAPKSFTGEDSVEFFLHGSALVATRFMETLIAMGIRQALPGEFSFRAVRNAKMTLSQAQATADLIGASNEGAATLALEKMSGTQGRLLTSIAEELRRTVMMGEVGIDFSDQDVEEVSLPSLRKRIAPLLVTLEKLRSSYSRGTLIQEGIRVAFVGLPNAGKSSFFNALLGEDRSIVSDIPGTTRDVVKEKLNLRGKRASVTLRLEDTAGLRSSSDHVEKMGIERTLKSAGEAELILFLVDAESLDAQFSSLNEQWIKLGRPSTRTLGIITKGDRVSESRMKEVRHKLEVFQLTHWSVTSALTGEGISEAAQDIADFSEKWVHRDQGEVLLTRLDHLNSVNDAISHLNRAAEASEIDLFASDMRQTLHALSPLIGETVPDDILGKIFSEFCIGK